MNIRLGVSINLQDPAIVEIAGWLGYSFAWIDCEQTLFPNVAEIIRAAETAGIEPWVRVPANDAAVIGQYLNLGAARIIVPHIHSAADAAAAVRHTKFSPHGERNWFSKARDGRYGIIPAKDYPARRAPQAGVVVQIEDPEGIENVDSILDVPGVDMVMTGPGDLAHVLGIAGRFEDQRIRDAEERVFRAADRRDIPVLHFADTGAELDRLVAAHRVSHVVAASDTTIVVTALRSRYRELSGPARSRQPPAPSRADR